MTTLKNQRYARRHRTPRDTSVGLRGVFNVDGFTVLAALWALVLCILAMAENGDLVAQMFLVGAAVSIIAGWSASDWSVPVKTLLFSTVGLTFTHVVMLLSVLW